MHTIPKAQTILSSDKRGLITEASTAGFGVGEWPEIVSVLDDRNEGFLFLKGAPIIHGGELGGYTYQTSDGAFTLTVFND